jgi:hypothetical protein
MQQIALPALDGLANGIATPMSIEALDFSPDDRNLLVKVSFLDSFYPGTLRSAVWEYNIASATYTALLNDIIITANPLLGAPDVTTAQYGSWQGENQILALMQDAADQSSLMGTSQNHLVLIRNNQVIDTDLLSTIAGAQANQLITAVRVTGNGRYAVVETSASNLTTDMSDTNEVADIYLLDLQDISIRRVTTANGAEVSEAALLGDVMIDNEGVLNITFSSAGNFTTIPDTNGAPDVFLWKAGGADAALSTNTTIELLSKAGNTAASGELPILTQAGVLFQSDSGLLAAQDDNGAIDVFLNAAADSEVSLITPGGILLADGASFGAAPDSGRYVALLSASSEVSWATGVEQLVVVDRNDGSYQVLSQIGGSLADDAAFSPVFSPTGKHIAFSSQAVNLQGGNPSPDMFMQLYLAQNTSYNEAPTALVFVNTVASIEENVFIGTGIRVANMEVTDDELGTNTLTLTGSDANSFEIRSGSLYYTGASPDFETKTSYTVDVSAKDDTLPDSTAVTQTFTIDVADVNEAPTISGVPATVQPIVAGLVTEFPDFIVEDVEPGILDATLTAINGTINGLADADPHNPGIQLTGTAAQISAAVAAATFTATASGDSGISLGVTDVGHLTAIDIYYMLASNAGIAPNIEDLVTPLPPPGGGAAVSGDGNGDGAADSQQLSVTSAPLFETATAQSDPGNAPQTFITIVADSNAGDVDASDGNSTFLAHLAQLDAPKGLPTALDMPLGLISFSANISEPGLTETFSLFIDSSINLNGYWTQGEDRVWNNIATMIEMVGDKTRIDFAITDGGQFDADQMVNGVIVNPGAIGFMPLSIVGIAPDANGAGFWF